MEELLSTKLFIPPTRADLVSRPRLIERLNGGLYHKLTLISASAGFGKTTLVTEWLETLHGNIKKKNQIDPRLAWLSLDEDDNDPTRFLIYFVTALNRVEAIDATIGERVLDTLQSPQPPQAETTLTSMINELATIPNRLILILDDYHLIEARSAHNIVNFLIENMPPQMHLVIATREDPPLHLARLRVRDQLTELRALDLRFTSSEAAEFLNQVMGLKLSTEDVVALGTRTEGWIAGLQLAAISMQGHEDTADLIESFTGSHRFVLDYLIEEVLEQQPESIQNFLLQTSILRRLNNDLCNAVTEQADSQTTLELLEHANLFIVPLDEERHWYRYHHLFADLLRQRLRQISPEQWSILHRKASEWYEGNGLVDEAIDYALRAEAFTYAAQLIEIESENTWVHGGDLKLRRWLDRLPENILFARPQLCIYHAWSLLAAGEEEAAERCLGSAEQAHTPHDPTIGRVAATRAFMAFYRGNVPGMVQFSRRALEQLSAEDLAWRSAAISTLGDAQDFNGEALAAYRTRLDGVEASKATGNSYQIIIANAKLALVLRQMGKLPQVIELCQQQLQFANDHGMAHSIVAGLLLAIWGETLAEIDDLDGAIRHAKRGVELAENGGDLAMLGWSYICLLRVLFSTGDMAGVEELIHKIERGAREHDMPPWIMNLVAAWQVRIWLAQGQQDAAAQWAEARDLTLNREFDYPHEMETIALARRLIARGDLGAATTLLRRQLEAAEAGGRTTRAIEILGLYALTLQAGGDTAEALVILDQVFNLAEPGGFVRTFVDEGPPMAALLDKAQRRDIAPVYARRLLAAFFTDKAYKSDRAEPQSTQSDLVEPLSERELEVLQLVAQGLTNREIGERLFLALDTVKGHNRHIYAKLQVHRRIDAIARARELGLLQA